MLIKEFKERLSQARRILKVLSNVDFDKETLRSRKALCGPAKLPKWAFTFLWLSVDFDHVDIIFLVYVIPSWLPVFLWHMIEAQLNLSLISLYKRVEDFVESGQKQTSRSVQSESK